MFTYQAEIVQDSVEARTQSRLLQIRAQTQCLRAQQLSIQARKLRIQAITWLVESNNCLLEIGALSQECKGVSDDFMAMLAHDVEAIQDQRLCLLEEYAALMSQAETLDSESTNGTSHEL